MPPKLWSESIQAHRGSVCDAILDACGALLAERSLASLNMSEIAQSAGIGRATLYKYFSGMDEVVVAWHSRQVARHLEDLIRARDAASDPQGRLLGVLHAYAQIA